MNEENYLKKELYELVKTDERIFDFIQEGSLDGLWYWDLQNPENEWMNTRFWKVLGHDPSLMPHKSSAWQDIINQDDLEIALDNFNKHCENPDHPYDQIVRYSHKMGHTVWIRCRGMAIRDEDGKPIRMLGAHQDISGLMEKEDQLKKSIKEREVLLAEIHHRVKNNLAVVSGMMQLQSSDEEDPVVKEKLSDSISRIKTIAKIHGKLYQNETFASIDLSETVRDLTFDNINSLSAGKKIELVVSMEPVILNINEAVPCSLIINEVLINALKHAFVNKESGSISVSVSEHEDLVKVIITDNGIGLPENFMRNNYSSGTMIIQVLTEQLEGESEYRRIKTGTEFVLQFPKTAVTVS